MQLVYTWYIGINIYNTTCICPLALITVWYKSTQNIVNSDSVQSIHTWTQTYMTYTHIHQPHLCPAATLEQEKRGRKVSTNTTCHEYLAVFSYPAITSDLSMLRTSCVYTHSTTQIVGGKAYISLSVYPVIERVGSACERLRINTRRDTTGTCIRTRATLCCSMYYWYNMYMFISTSVHLGRIHPIA